MGERDIVRLLQLVAKHLGREWVGSVEWLRSLPQNSVDEIERRLVAGDISGVVKEVESAAARFAAESNAQYIRAGREGAKWLDSQPQLDDKLIRFDASGARSVQRAQRNQYQLVRETVQEQRDAIRVVMQDSTGRNPRDLARDIRSTIGLTANQAQHVKNYRRQLEQGQYADAMARRLHDDRHNPTLRRGEPLTPEQIDRMTERYRANYIAYRAETIARTESARHVHEGLAEAYTQAIERGDIEADELVKEWIPGPRTKDARDSHRSAELLRQRPKVNEPFVLDDGARLMFPGVGGDADDTANCRCTWATTLDPKPKNADSTIPLSESPRPAYNPRRQAAARIAAAASVERRREIHSAARSNLPPDLHAVWDKEGHKFMREEAERIRGVKDRVNASSTLSQAFAEKYGSGEETMFGNEGDRFHVRAEIEARHAEEWADEQERRYYAAAQEALDRGEDAFASFAPSNPSDDDPPF